MKNMKRKHWRHTDCLPSFALRMHWMASQNKNEHSRERERAKKKSYINLVLYYVSQSNYVIYRTGFVSPFIYWNRRPTGSFFMHARSLLIKREKNLFMQLVSPNFGNDGLLRRIILMVKPSVLIETTNIGQKDLPQIRFHFWSHYLSKGPPSHTEFSFNLRLNIMDLSKRGKEIRSKIFHVTLHTIVTWTFEKPLRIFVISEQLDKCTRLNDFIWFSIFLFFLGKLTGILYY